MNFYNSISKIKMNQMAKKTCIDLWIWNQHLPKKIFNSSKLPKISEAMFSVHIKLNKVDIDCNEFIVLWRQLA